MSAVRGGLVLHLRAPLLCSRHCSSSPTVADETTPHHNSPSTPPSPSNISREGGRQERSGQDRDREGGRQERWGQDRDKEDGPQVRYTNPWKLKLERYRKHISNLVRKSRQAEAVELFEQMKRSKVRPDVGVYNTVLSGYRKQRDLKNAFKTFNEVSIPILCPSIVFLGGMVERPLNYNYRWGCGTYVQAKMIFLCPLVRGCDWHLVGSSLNYSKYGRSLNLSHADPHMQIPDIRDPYEPITAKQYYVQGELFCKRKGVGRGG